LAGEAELAGDLGLADPGGKRLGGPWPAGFELLAVVSGLRAARCGGH
jgi:hypothetical protein